MSTTTTNYGLIKPDTTDPILIGQLNDNADTIDATMKSISDALDVAKLGIKYKGEVNYYSNLPNSAEIGDAYTVKYAGSSGTTPDGTEYVWGTVSGTNQWINFSKDSYTKAEVDALLTLKQNALSSTQLAAVNSGINSTKVGQIETNKNNILLNWGGAKNLTTITGGTTEVANRYIINNQPLSLVAGDYVVSFKTTATTGANAITIYDSNANPVGTVTIANATGTVYGDITITANSANIYVFATVPETITEFMICTRADWEKSPVYAPYAMSNTELTAKEQANKNNISLLTNGLYPTAYTKPTSATGIFLQSGGYCMIGNICVVCLQFSDSSAVAANTTIFSGLPLPVKDSTIGENRILIAVANNKNIELNVTSSGNILLGGTALSGANDIITASAVYLAQS